MFFPDSLCLVIIGELIPVLQTASWFVGSDCFSWPQKLVLSARGYLASPAFVKLPSSDPVVASCSCVFCFLFPFGFRCAVRTNTGKH